MKLIYIVIAWSVSGDFGYDIDSVWTSEKKAYKRCKELNANGSEWLVENRGCGLFDVEQYFISH